MVLQYRHFFSAFEKLLISLCFVKSAVQHLSDRFSVYADILDFSPVFIIENHPLFSPKGLTDHSKFTAKPIEYILFSSTGGDFYVPL